MFQWFYWHALLPGRDIPGITADMPAAGKHLDPAPTTEPTDRETTMTTATLDGVDRRPSTTKGFFEDPTSGPKRWPLEIATELKASTS